MCENRLRRASSWGHARHAPRPRPDGRDARDGTAGQEAGRVATPGTRLITTQPGTHANARPMNETRATCQNSGRENTPGTGTRPSSARKS